MGRVIAFEQVLLPVTDTARSKSFYTGVLGLGCRGDEDDCVYLAAPSGSQIMLHGGESEPIPPGQRVELWFEVEEIDEIVDRLRSSGVEVSEPKDMPWGARIAGLRDPDGYEVWISESTR